MNNDIATSKRRSVCKRTLAAFCTIAAAGGILAAETNSPTSYSRGIRHLDKKEWDGAITDFADAIRLNPTNASAYQHRASAYFAKGSWDNAIGDLTQVVKLQPSNGSAYLSRASACRAARRLDEAIADVNQCLRLNPTNHEAYMLRAASYSFKGEFAKAINDWNEGLRLKPDNVAARTCRGADYFQSGQFDKAVRDHREAIARDPECALAYNNLAWLLATCPSAEMRNGKDAVQAATRACELTHWKIWDDIDTLAAAYAEVGDFERAVQYQKHALSFEGINETDRKQAKHKLSMYEHRQSNHDGQKE